MIANVRLTLSLALVLAACVFLILDRIKPAPDRLWLWLAVLLLAIERLTPLLPAE